MSFETLLAPITLTIALAATVTAILLIVGTPIALWLARSKSAGTTIVGALVTLPLVLPPTVLGFYLLLALGPFGPGGALAGLWRKALSSRLRRATTARVEGMPNGVDGTSSSTCSSIPRRSPWLAS